MTDTTTLCDRKHEYTITGEDGQILATTRTGRHLAALRWKQTSPQALDLTATHRDRDDPNQTGDPCPTETRAARALLPHGPYETRQDARIDGQPLRDAVDAATEEHDGPRTDAEYDAMRQAATAYLSGRLGRLGIELGAFDQRVAAWIADWDPEVAATVLGWVTRARAAGRDTAIEQRREPCSA